MKPVNLFHQLRDLSLFGILAMILLFGLSGQVFGALAGDNLSTPIVAGSYSSAFQYSDTKNTTAFSNAYSSRSPNDVFYKFTLTQRMKVTLTHCGSSIDTYMHLLDASGALIISNDDWSGEGACSSIYHSVIQRELAAGAYYVVSEGYSQNGEIKTSISGVIPPAVSSMPTIVIAGSFDTSFEYSDTKNTKGCPDVYRGRSNNEVFYQFKLTKKMMVTITHCGSAINTYMYLLETSNNPALSSYSGVGTCYSYLQPSIQRELEAGTYYAVSEGYDQNGEIQTNISGAIYGDKRSHPVVAGSFGGNSQYSDTRNTTAFTNAFTSADQGRSTNDVFYRMTLTRKLTVTLTHCGSSIDTYMHLLDASGNLIVSNDDYSGDGACSSSYHSFIQRDLEAGTYYVVSEGYGQNGEIQTNITTHVNEFGYTDSPNPYSSEPEGVGSTAGSFDVSPTGAATFSIPIEVPPGVGGMQPAIAIAYNSQAGNGVAGWGCGIAGISAITRAPKTIYHDSQASGITHGLADAFVLDGQRLVHDSGCGISEGKAGAVYHPENDPLTKVTVYGTYTSEVNIKTATITDNRWFKIEREGTTCYYGRTNDANTTDSRQEYTYTGSRLPIPTYHRINAWYLGYMEDVHGNYMVYNYTDQGDAGARYIKSITYGKNTGASSTLQNSIIFSYTGSRQDEIIYHMEGVRVDLTHRLSSIACQTGNSAYRIYTLEYNTTGDGSGIKYSRLTSVTVKNGAGEALKPVTLNWDYLQAFSQTSYSPDVVNFTHSSDNKYGFMSADMNGDGMDDLIQITVYPVPRITDQWARSARIHFGAMNANGDIWFTAVQTYNVDAFNSSYPHEDCIPIDLDGDGAGELLIPNHYKSSYEYELKFVGGSMHDRTFLYDFKLDHGLYYKPVYAKGDMDNDGKEDFIFIEAVHDGSNMYSCVLARHSQGQSLNWNAYDLYLPSPAKKMFVADFNGDGLNDIMILYTGGYKLFWNQGAKTIHQAFLSNQSVSGTNVVDLNIHMGDFNGDGLPDFLMASDNSGMVYIAINNGDGTFNRDYCAQFGNVETITDCQVFDFDMDGKSDVVITRGKTSPRTYWLRTIKNSSLSGFGPWVLQNMAYTDSYYQHDAEKQYITSGDFNGDGQVELLNFGYRSKYGNSTQSSPIWRLYSNPNYNANKGKVTSITSGYGTTTAVSYASLLRDGFYTRGTGAVYPVTDRTLPLHAVKTVTETGVTGNITTSYQYAGLKLHLKGRGVMGMTSIRAANATTGVTVETGVRTWNADYFIPSEIYSKTTVEGRTAETDTKLTIIDHGSKLLLVYPHQKTEKDLDGNTSTTTYKFDDLYGYLTEEKTEYGSGSMYLTRQYGDHILAGGAYRPQSLTVIRKHADDGSAFTQKTSITYNTAKGYPVSMVENDKPAIRPSTEYTGPTTQFTGYDAFGNCTSYKVMGVGLATMTYYHEYDATGRFIVKSYTSPASTTAAFTYDTWGNVLTETDATNPADLLTTRHTYNGWGQKTSSVSPDGVKTTFHTGWNSNNVTKRYFTLVQGHGRPWVKTWYDRFGRETGVETIGPKSMRISKTHTYNNKGQLTQTQNRQGSLTVTETYDYDGRGRLKSQSASNGQTSTYSYGNRSQTTVSNGRSYTKTFDAWGNIRSSVDWAGSVSYTYHSSGQPKTVNASGATFTMTYDDAGNRTSLTDPDAGTTTWRYDAARRVETQTDSRGNVLRNSYDGLNRISSSSLGAIHTEYTYGTSGSDLHRLIRVKSGNNQIAWTYDRYGRPLTEKRNIDGVGLLEFSFAYNSNGQLATTVCPGGLQVNSEYDPYGNPVQISAGTLPVWTLTGANGVTTTTLLGGSMTATTILNSQGWLTGLKTLKGTASIRNMEYAFNGAAGHLTSRTGMIPQKETFYYDHLDRLTDVKHGAETLAMSVGYSNKGNISCKTGIGAYRYNASKVHALEEVDNTGGLIPEGDQAITYNAFNKVSQISETAGDETCQLNITYGPDRQRWKTELRRNGSVAKTVIFAGNYEQIIKNDTVTHLYYIEGGGIYVKQVKGSTILKDGMYYVHPDHLGSLMIITDAAGTVKQKCSFDAWGKRTFVTKDPSLIFDRGFTGHEHLDEFGLINMNGRMYDPIVGRFLSPDPFVPDMTYSQDFNRYSYARNNPLKYTDPDGEFIHLIIGAIIGGTINLAANWKNIDGNFWKGVGYFGVGAITGAGSAALGSWVVGATQSAGIITGAMVGAGTGAVTSAVSSVTLNGLNNVVGGQNFWNNWQQNAISGAIGGGISGGIAGGMKGYQLAKDGGKNMWWGGDVKYGRNQWSFFNSEKPYETISWDINNVGSKSLNDCVPTSYAEMNDYFGGSTSYEEYKTITSYQENVGVKTDRGGYERMLGRNFTGDRYDALNLSDPQAARDIVNKGQLVHTNMPYSGIRHVDNLRSIMYYSNKTVLHYRIGSYRLSSVNGNWWFYLFNGIR